MELPSALRQAIDRALAGTPADKLADASTRLSRGYRDGDGRPDRPHVADSTAALAYLASRMPATYAATRAALGMAAERVPAFTPRRLLDVGAGPGTALWAAADLWPTLREADLLEASAAMRAAGAALGESGLAVTWHAAEVTGGLPKIAPADLVTAAYVVNELPARDMPALIDRLWTLTLGMLVVVEPGTPAGYDRVLAVRERLIGSGAHIVAPCPHALACPLSRPDWCHFSQRVSRSRSHRIAKRADVGWEDERYIALAATRIDAAAPSPRIVAPVSHGHGHLSLKLCKPDGTIETRSLSRRNGASYRAARRARWGDTIQES
ncbi:MAG: methyltransferase type 11 [Alphaproteobacteria bacterium]|nr:methyltransferase type 11 [Alphaproteobacteria bacterium]